MAKTYLSNMDQIFVILTLIKLSTEFDNIREHILIGSATPTIDDIFAWLLRHSSTTIRSRHSEVSIDTSVMFSSSHPRGDSRSVLEANNLIVPTVIDQVTFETGVISYMAVHLALPM